MPKGAGTNSTRALEIEWHGNGIFSEVGTPPRRWQDVLDNAAAIRLLANVSLGCWRTVYEVDVLDWSTIDPEPQRTRTQWLVGG